MLRNVLGSVLKPLTYTLQIAAKFTQAKSEASPGGKEVTVGEMAGIGASVTAAWADADSLDRKITEAELCDAYRANGWVVIPSATPKKSTVKDKE